MKILAFDTATEACSAAVWNDGTVVERLELGQRHSQKILPLVDELLAEAGVALTELDAIAFGRGPGSFTGLRIGAGVAQGLAFGADLPVVPVSSLAALALGTQAPKVLAAIDARMQQVYWAAYTKNARGRMELQGEELVIAPSAVPLPDDMQWTGAGSGWEQYASVLSERLGDRLATWRSGIYPRARFVAELGAADFSDGKAVAAEAALPVYIRDDVAKKKEG